MLTDAGSATSRWNWSRCMPRASASTALMTSPCDTTAYTASSPSRAFHSRTAATRAHLHVAHRLTALAGERHRRRVRLDHLPQRVLGELLELLARPVAVAHLADPVVDVPGHVVAPGEHQVGRLEAALQRAGDDRRQRHRREPAGQGASPASRPASSRDDPLGPAGEHAGAVGRGPAVADEQHRGHDGSLRDVAHSTARTSGQAHNGGVIVDCALYHPGPPGAGAGRPRRRARHGPRRPATRFIWIGLHEPDRGRAGEGRREFGLHPLAVEDAVKAHQRPKVEEFDGLAVRRAQDGALRRGDPAGRPRRRDALPRRLVHRVGAARQGPGARRHPPAAGDRSTSCSTAGRPPCCTP